jgi:hypothetical protein
LKPFDTTDKFAVLVPQDESKPAEMAIMLSHRFHCGDYILEMAVCNFLTDVVSACHWQEFAKSLYLP